MIRPKPRPMMSPPRPMVPQQRVMMPTIMRDQGHPGRSILIAAAVLLVIGGWACLKGAETLNWPQASARMLVSNKWMTIGDRRQDGHSTDERRDVPVEFRYAYRVGKQDYTGTAVQPYDFGSQDWLVPYRTDEFYGARAVLRASYDPSDPSVAYLEPGPSGAALILFGVGFLVGLGGMWVRYTASQTPRTFA